jgi:asparagine synthase (glutamine-hydrolysing)
MCGIAGIIGSNKIDDVVQKMQQACNTLQHRGPNANNCYINSNENIALAHTRLSIIDLSPNANQPFKYLNYVAVYNGEIYNFKEIKTQLQQKQYKFTTQSDTEVLIAAYDYWGNECVNIFDGMFAFVIYNQQTQSIFAARDAFGEKPFYYSLQNNQFIFSSEIASLFTLGAPKQHNYTEWVNYINLGHTSNCKNQTTTFYKNIFHLPQGHFMDFKVENNLNIHPIQWFKIQHISVDYNNPEEQFKSIFEHAISKKLIADVPLATSLSGGVDSSCIVTAINNVSQKNNYSFKTFTASFEGFDKDETYYSKSICKSLGIQQILVQPTVSDLMNDLPLLLKQQQEPTQSTSVFTQWMVYKTAAKHGIKVIIDGQGADEILGGYSKQMEWFLVFLKNENQQLFKELKTKLIENQFINSWEKKHTLASLLPLLLQTIANSKNAFVSKHSSCLDAQFTNSNYSKSSTQKPIVHNFKSLLNYHSTIFGLPSLLRFADRNSMAFGVEVRLPFLSKEVASFLFNLPNELKVKNGFTKYILRNYLANNNFEQIAWRKGKIGFEPPQQQWMQDARFQSLIMDVKQSLYHQKIITKKYAEAPINPAQAHSKNNTDWRILNMGFLIQ